MKLLPDSQIPLADLLEHVASEPTVWVRVAAVAVNGEWQQSLLELTSGAPPPSWKRMELRYEAAVLLATRRKGVTVASWLRRRRVRFGGYSITLPELVSGTVQVRRLDSHAPGKFETLPWPSLVADLSSTSLMQNQQPDVLAADGYPTFMNLYAAAAYFFWLRRDPYGGQLPQGITYRHQDTAARINHVRFGSEQVVVEVEGTQLAGTTVEVAGEVPGPSKRLSRRSNRRVRFALPEGLPPAPFVLVRRGGEWLDRRYLKWPHARGDQPDVEEEVEIEATTKLQLLIENRENEQAEFKSRLPADTDDAKRTVMKTVAAFANGNGGSLLFGITKDYETVGMVVSSLDDAQDRVSDLIDAWVTPRPLWTFETYRIDGKPGYVVLALHVQQGTEPPYGIGTQSVPTRYYVRHAGRSVPAHPNELRELARTRPAGDPPGLRH